MGTRMKRGASVKYVRLAVEVEAIQYLGELNHKKVEAFIGRKLAVRNGYLIVPQDDFNFLVKRKNYIVRGLEGEFYIVEEDIFKLTYEAINEGGKKENNRRTKVELEEENLSPGRLDLDI
ncbi:hypothetical protein [Bacillus sp. AFS088145]|uniref:hypothetical protein n=1 Tax=Bacillus sp. AFS088145 TaxID=2033514 RepID=UPI000BF7253D|nr:hypothetical protein [Bacillus sp. AFS088145]PFH81617.1 hypothetical protein COI44_22845 [Bacillus sp. AFS088145]